MDDLEKLKKQKFLFWIPFGGAIYFIFRLVLINKKNKFLPIYRFIFLNGIRTFLELLGFAIILVLLFNKKENIIIVTILFILWADILLILMSQRLLKKTDQMAHLKETEESVV